MVHAVFSVKGMHCSSCSAAVEGALRALPGMATANVALLSNNAEVEFDSWVLGDAEVADAIEAAGFEARLQLSRPARDGSGGGAAIGATESDVQLLAVRGMTCSACSAAVEGALRKLPGVRQAAASLVTGRVEVVYDPDATGPRHLLAAVHAAGFEADTISGQQLGFVDQNRAETAAWRRELIIAALLTAPVFLVAMVFPMLDCMHWLYSCMVLGFPLDQLVKLAFATPVQFWSGWRFHRGAYLALRRGRANMNVLVSLGTNASFAYSLISVLHHHVARHHMTGAYRPTDFFETCAFLITLVLLGKYLESAAKGRTSEAITKLCQLAPPTALLVDADEKGALLREEEVPTALVHRGDLLKVLPGARVPADGEVVEGTSYLDESMLTGEPAPVRKSVGDAVIGGTVNTRGPLLVRASRVGADTALAQVVRLVEAAQLAKAPIQAFADRVSAVFVPVVVGLAATTCLAWYLAGWLGWYPDAWLPQGHTVFLFALLFGIAVLVIACPCALGLATPTAVMVGTGVAATNGILIKGGDALERACHVRTVVFDKTGTLTEGRPNVVDFKLTEDCAVSADDVVRLAAAVEQYSEHPLASAVLAFSNTYLAHPWEQQQQQQAGSAHAPLATGQRGAAGEAAARLPVRDVDVVVGQGIRGWVSLPSPGHSQLGSTAAGASSRPPSVPSPPSKGTRGTAVAPPGEVQVAVGNRSLMAEAGVQVPASAEAYCRGMEARGCTFVFVAAQQSLLGVLAVMDPIKPEARGVVTALHQRGMHSVLLTGDNWHTARAVAEQLGIKQVIAEVLPDGKVGTVQELQAGGSGMVAMVGDGINDSPALAQADVGIAVGSGTDIAIEAADFVLIRSDLDDVLCALDLSATTIARVKWNYLFAMLYNICMIPVAAGVLYPVTRVQLPPWIAGACMALSSVSVVASSLLLRCYRRPKPVLRDVLVIKR